MYELKPVHRLPQNVGLTQETEEQEADLDTSEFGALMGEKLKANREDLPRKSTWGTLKMSKY